MSDAIIANFGMNNKNFKRGVRENERELGNFKKTLGGIKRAISAAFAFAGVGIGVGQIKNLVNELDRLGKSADKLGLTTRELQELRFAGEQTGVAANTMDMALQRFTRRLSEARQGSGEAKGALEELNIELRDSDGTARSNIVVFRDVADALGSIEDPAERTRLAFKFFDSEGVNLVNTLKDGSKGLDEFANKLERVGGIIDDEAVRKAEELNDRLKVIGQSAKGTITNMTLAVLKFYEGVDKGFNSIEKVGFFASEDEMKEYEKMLDQKAKADQDAANETKKSEALRLAAIQEQKIAQEAVDAFNEKLSERRAKRLEQLEKAEAKLSSAIQRFAFDQLSLTDRKIFLEKELNRVRKEALEGGGALMQVELRMQYLNLTKELLTTEERLRDEVKRKQEERAAAQAEMIDNLTKANELREQEAEKIKNEADEAERKAIAEADALASLQGQAIARAAGNPDSRDGRDSRRVIDMRAKAQELEGDGRFDAAARMSGKADKLEGEITDRRRGRLEDAGREALESGDYEKLNQLRRIGERQGLIPEKERTLSGSMAEAGNRTLGESGEANSKDQDPTTGLLEQILEKVTEQAQAYEQILSKLN